MVKVGRNSFDLKASVQRYTANLRATAAGRSADGDIDLVTERALLARQQRIGQEIKNDLAASNVVPIDDVVGGFAASNLRVKQKILGLATKIAPRAAVLKSAEQVRALIEGEVLLALKELTFGGEGHVRLDEARAMVSRMGGARGAPTIKAASAPEDQTPRAVATDARFGSKRQRRQ